MEAPNPSLASLHSEQHSQDEPATTGQELPNKTTSASKRERFKPSLTLENSGSVARDHLASERTFLAYVRTSLAIVSTGVALVQLFTIAPSASSKKAFARPLGATTVLFGLLVLAIGIARYFTVQSALISGKFPVARVVAAAPGMVLCVLFTIVFGFLIANR